MVWNQTGGKEIDDDHISLKILPHVHEAAVK